MPRPHRRRQPKLQRNAPCSCGSSRKAKKCCEHTRQGGQGGLPRPPNPIPPEPPTSRVDNAHPHHPQILASDHWSQRERAVRGFHCWVGNCGTPPTIGLIATDRLTGSRLGLYRLCKAHVSVGKIIHEFHRDREIRLQNVRLSRHEPINVIGHRVWPGIPEIVRNAWVTSFSDFVSTATVHLSVPGTGGTRASGTGTLFEVGDVHFLITARHVFRDEDDGHDATQRLSHTTLHTRSQLDVPLTEGSLLLSGEEQDVAIVFFPQRVAQLLKENGLAFLGLESVIIEGQANGNTLLAGFPADSMETDYDSPEIFYMELDRETREVRGQLTFPLGPLGPGETQHRIPHGISGGSIWSILPTTMNDFIQAGEFHPSKHVKVIGVQTHYALPEDGDAGSETYCVGTAWGAIAAALRSWSLRMRETLDQTFPQVNFGS